MKITLSGIVPARYEVHGASPSDKASVIAAVQILGLDCEIPEFSDVDPPDLVVIARTEAKADQFEAKFWPSITREK